MGKDKEKSRVHREKHKWLINITCSLSLYNEKKGILK